jgi:DNA polymerase elongation subunit (family B)
MSFGRDGKYSGAIVRTPKIGYYEFIIDFDASSMYPSIMRTLNISPETLILQVLEDKEFIKRYLRPYLLQFDKDELDKVIDIFTLPLDPNYQPNFDLRRSYNIEEYKTLREQIKQNILETINSEEFEEKSVNVIYKDKITQMSIREIKETIYKEVGLSPNEKDKDKIRGKFTIAVNGSIFRYDKIGVLKLIEDSLTELRSVYKNRKKIAGKLISHYLEEY